MVSYAVHLVTRYDGMVIATFPDLPGITALGRDDQEACEEARRALVDALDACRRDGVDPPAPNAAGASRIEVELIARPTLA